MGTCRYCNQSAGTSSFNETALRSTLRAIADRARATPNEISGAIAAGWTQGVKHAMSDGILTPGPEQLPHGAHCPGPGG